VNASPSPLVKFLKLSLLAVQKAAPENSILDSDHFNELAPTYPGAGSVSTLS